MPGPGESGADLRVSASCEVLSGNCEVRPRLGAPISALASSPIRKSPCEQNAHWFPGSSGRRVESMIRVIAAVRDLIVAAAIVGGGPVLLTAVAGPPIPHRPPTAAVLRAWLADPLQPAF